MLILLVFSAILLATAYHLLIEPLYLNPKSKIPGPKSYALTKLRLALEDFQGTRTRTIHALHQKYGPIVRVGPNEIHFNSLNALRTIYGAGSGFERTWFYRMFDAYGRQNLFTFHSVKEHSDRKKLVANAYSKSLMLKGPDIQQSSLFLYRRHHAVSLWESGRYFCVERRYSRSGSAQRHNRSDSSLSELVRGTPSHLD